MEVTSLDFAWFVLAMLVLYYAVPKRWQNIILLGGSYYFYYQWSPSLLVFCIVATAFNWFYGKWLATFARKKEYRYRLWLGIAANVLLMLYPKYADLYVDALKFTTTQVGITPNLAVLRLVLFVGVSYYMLSLIGYLVDVFRKQGKPADNIVDFALFVAYFPKINSGPIERARTFIPQLQDKRQVDNPLIARSVGLILLGLARKLMIADPLSSLVPPNIFVQPGNVPAILLLLYMIGFLVAMYYEFVGYMEIVRGVSGLFGIELTRNFKEPLRGRTFAEFWTRWHISFSTWLRDYIFFPMSRNFLRRFKNPKHPANIVVPILVTMTISGFWHAVTPAFVVWGMLHGSTQIYERVMQIRRNRPPVDKWPLWEQRFVRFRNIFIASIINLFFIMPLGNALAYLRSMITNWGSFGLPPLTFFGLILAAVLFETRATSTEDETFFLSWPTFAQSTAYAVVVLAIFLFTRADVGEPFIYQGF